MKKSKQRELEASWQKLLKAHSKPLERGAKANGLSLAPEPRRVPSKPYPGPGPGPNPKKRIYMGSATVPVVDPLAEAKRALKVRVGQAYNKGGIQYLTDDELAEQKTGAHKRR